MDKENISSLIEDNKKLIYKLASEYSSLYNAEDLYQVGIIGIIKAYKNYDRNSNVKFSTYAYKYIMGEMINFIKKDRNIIVSDEYFEIYKRYLKIKDLFLNKYEREASLKEISEIMGLSEHKLVSIIESVAYTKSGYECVKYYNDEREDVINRIIINDSLDGLEEDERRIINYRYYDGLSQSETAQKLGLSQVKVSRSEKLILSKMKNKIAA